MPGSGPSLLVGPNGAGKTSALEAVYLLATSRSFRASRVEDCCRLQAAEFMVSGRVENDVRSDLEFLWGYGGRRLRLNGKTVNGPSYIQILPVICWSAADLKVIEGAPRDRRRFLDQGIVSRQPATVEILSRYRRSLEHKRELLRRGSSGLSAWNQVLAEAASSLIGRRQSFVASLMRQLRSIVEESDLDLPQIRLRYRPSPSLAEPSSASLFEAFESMARRERDEARVLVGPHRDQLEIIWGDTEISKIASAGEKKLVGILLCAARGRVLSEAGRQPIALLDDIDAELDRDRLQAAWKLYNSLPQVIATTCHEAVQESLEETRIWRLESGTIAAG